MNSLTCSGQHCTGEEQGGHKVPVPVGGITKDGHSIVTGLERASQQFLQVRVGHAGVVAQEVLPCLFQLLSKLVFVGQLDGGEDPGTDEEVEDVGNDQQRKVDPGLVPLREESAPVSDASGYHHSVELQFLNNSH